MPSSRAAVARPRTLLGALVLSIGAVALLAALGKLTIIPQFVFIAALLGVAALFAAVIVHAIAAALHSGNKWELLPLALVLAIFIQAAIRMATTSFAVDDEIYSWNMWAVQHARGEAIDITYTQAPYPQLFSLFVAASYRAMDSVLIQAVPRLFASIPALVFFLAILWAGRGRPLVATFVVSVLVFGLHLNRELAIGLADPLMAATLLTSVMLVIHFHRNPHDERILSLSVAAAIIACFTKQPALIWGCFTLPVLIAIGCARGRYRPRALLLAALCLAGCLVWPLLAPSFTSNSGVIAASMGQRNYLQQFAFAADRYLLRMPLLAALLIASAVMVYRDGFLRGIWLFGLLPMTVAWFLFGAYQFRLGIHVAGLAALLVMAGWPPPPDGVARSRMRKSLARVSGIVAVALVALIIAAGVALDVIRRNKDLRNGPRMTVVTQFGPNAGAVFDRLVAENARIWTTGNYAYGPFYGVLPVGRPDYGVATSEDRIKRDLLAFNADYAIYTGSVAFGPHAPILKSLAERCPMAFAQMLGPPNQFGFILYRIDRNILSDACRT